MKKIIAFIVFAVIGIQAHAQLFEGEGLKANDKSFELGIIGGALGVYDDLSTAAIGINFSAYGVYIDFLGWPRSHASTTDVAKHENEKTSFGIHAGYQFPLTKWVSIAPLVGYVSVKNGTTDGSKWTINNGHINNSYSVKEKNQGFDYGGMLCFKINRVRLYAAGTRYGLYGGIGIGF